MGSRQQNGKRASGGDYRRHVYIPVEETDKSLGTIGSWVTRRHGDARISLSVDVAILAVDCSSLSHGVRVDALATNCSFRRPDAPHAPAPCLTTPFVKHLLQVVRPTCPRHARRFRATHVLPHQGIYFRGITPASPSRWQVLQPTRPQLHPGS